MVARQFVVDPGFKVFVADLRLSWTRVLQCAGLPEALAIRAPTQVTTGEYFRLWTALEEEAGERSIAVDVGTAMSTEAFNPAMIAALCSRDLAAAAARVATYKPLIGPTTMDVVDTPETVEVRYTWPDRLWPPALLAISELVFWVALARSATRHPIQPTQVTIPALPRRPEDIETYLGAVIERADSHAIRFSATDAARPFLTADDSFAGALDRQLHHFPERVGEEGSATYRLETALRDTLPGGDPTTTSVTAKLAVSSRTLQRQLAAEGTTYQQVLACTRERLAREYLSQRDMRMSDIAFLLGYRDTNSFFRAFTTWTGLTPQ